MNARAFLEVAEELATGIHEGHWRSAISRGYYAAFHGARSVFEQCGFDVPESERVHAYCCMRLMNSGHPDVALAGRRLDALRTERNIADYDLRRIVKESEAIRHIETAADILRLLEEAAALPHVLAQITLAMRDYERNVLQDVTWQGP